MVRPASRPAAGSAPARSPAKRSRPASIMPRPLDVRILDEFEERAAARGIRAVVMSELARDLGISTKTLYREYATKAELVAALMERWRKGLSSTQSRRLASVEDPVERITGAALASLDHIDGFSSDFWRDLRKDYPEEFGRYLQAVNEALVLARDWLAGEARAGIDMTLAGPLLLSLLRSAADPRLCDRVGVTRREAVTAAVEIWAHGALRPSEPPTR